MGEAHWEGGNVHSCFFSALWIQYPANPLRAVLRGCVSGAVLALEGLCFTHRWILFTCRHDCGHKALVTCNRTGTASKLLA